MTKTTKTNKTLTVVGPMAVVILCNAPSDVHLRTIVACTQHFDADRVHVVDYGSTTTCSTSGVEEALGEFDLHTVHYSYCHTSDKLQALAAALAMFMRQYPHILLVDGKASRRPVHLQRGLQHFAQQSSFLVTHTSSRKATTTTTAAAAASRLGCKAHTGGGTTTTTHCRGPDDLMKLTGGTYRFQFNLWDRKVLQNYLEEYEHAQEYQRRFMPRPDYAPIAFY